MTLPSGVTFRQGEHILLCGPTGCGKTTLASELLADRKYVVMLRTKPRDMTYRKMSLKPIHSWPPPWYAGTRVMLSPKSVANIDLTIARQEALFKHCANRISLDTGWTFYSDETLYLIEFLGMTKHISVLHEQARSAGVTMVLATQRPSKIPLLAYSGTTHYFIWNTTFDDDVKRLSALGGNKSRELAKAIVRLPKHDYIYVNPFLGKMIYVPSRKAA